MAPVQGHQSMRFLLRVTVANVQVSPQVKPLLDSLRTLYQTCAGAPQMQAPNKKREMDDNSKKMGQLFWKLNAG